MRRNVRLALFILCCTVTAAAQEPSPSIHSVTPRVVASLLEGLSSDNPGLQRSCALMLGHVRCDRSRFALMKLLRNGADDRCRAAAAWALCRLGDPSGLMVVRTVAEKDDDPRLRAVCAWYYQQAMQEQGRAEGPDRYSDIRGQAL